MELTDSKYPQKSSQELLLRSSTVLLCLWVAFLVGAMFYVGRSGGVQPADLLMIAIIGLTFSGVMVGVPAHIALYSTAGLFLGYVAAVNWIWYVIVPDFKFLEHSVYYAYNFAIFVVVVTLCRARSERFVLLTRWAIIAALLLQLALIQLGFSSGRGRETGTFNNPNQLAYWALLLSASYLVLQGGRRLSITDLCVLLLGGYITALSLSKAGMLGWVILLGSALFCQGIKNRLHVALLGLSALAAVALIDPTLLSRLMQTEAIVNVDTRMQTLGETEDDNLEGRGYDRIWLNPEYLILGAGEGEYSRFDSILNLEMHSLFANILFSYGIIGFILFMGFLYQVFRKAPWPHWLYFSSIVFYGLAHQGLRFSFFWVFLALVFALARYAPLSKASSQCEARRETVQPQSW